MSGEMPSDIDGSGNQWYCSVTKFTEYGLSPQRMPPFVWSCATPKQCNATCEDTDDDEEVPKCSGGYWGERIDQGGEEGVSYGGLRITTWCDKATSNANQPMAAIWSKGGSFPHGMNYRLPFSDPRHPTKNAAAASLPGRTRALWVSCAGASLLAAFLRLI